MIRFKLFNLNQTLYERRIYHNYYVIDPKMSCIKVKFEKKRKVLNLTCDDRANINRAQTISHIDLAVITILKTLKKFGGRISMPQKKKKKSQRKSVSVW